MEQIVKEKETSGKRKKGSKLFLEKRIRKNQVIKGANPRGLIYAYMSFGLGEFSGRKIRGSQLSFGA